MGIWEVSPDDMKQDIVVTVPSWYCCEVTISVLGVDKNGAALWRLTAKILNEGEYFGVPVRWNYSEKAKSMSNRFLKAIGATIDPMTGVRMNTDAAVGRRVELYVAPREWEGRLLSDVKDCRPCKHETIPPGNSDNG